MPTTCTECPLSSFRPVPTSGMYKMLLYAATVVGDAESVLIIIPDHKKSGCCTTVLASILFAGGIRASVNRSNSTVVTEHTVPYSTEYRIATAAQIVNVVCGKYWNKVFIDNETHITGEQRTWIMARQRHKR